MRDQNMTKIITQLDILLNKFMGVGSWSFNVMDVRCVSPYKAKFEALYNKQVNFPTN